MFRSLGHVFCHSNLLDHVVGNSQWTQIFEVFENCYDRISIVFYVLFFAEFIQKRKKSILHRVFIAGAQNLRYLRPFASMMEDGL